MSHHLKAIFLLFIITTNAAVAQSDADLVKDVVNKATIESHIYFLASDELKGRATGSPEIDIAARYLATTLRSYGVGEVPGAPDYFQPVVMETIKPPSLISLKLKGKGVDDISGLISLIARNVHLESDLIFVDYGLEDDYKGKEVKGKIVIAKAGSAKEQQGRAMLQLSRGKRSIASKMGAIALIEFTTADERTWKSVSGYFANEKFDLAVDEEADIMAHLWVRDADEKFLMRIKNKDVKTAEIEVAGANTTRIISKNVVGMVEGTDPKLKDEFIIYSAHYDHVGIGAPNAEGDSIYNGARDNAVGSVTVLSAAESIAKNPTKRSALFVLFTGEEKGLLGSTWYVEHPLIPLNQMVYCFNSDNASYNDTSVATIVGLNRTTAASNIKKACETFGLKALDDPAPEQNLFDRSDNVKFAAKGIPAPTFSLGFTAFDAEVFRYYHQVTDNPDNLDYDYLLKFFQSYVLACRLIANDQETPFWVEGDKYYQAGKQLYK